MLRYMDNLALTYASTEPDLSSRMPYELYAAGFGEVVLDWAQPIMILDRELRFVFANTFYLAMVNRDWSEIAGRFVCDAFPENDARQKLALARLRRTLAGETVTLDAAAYNMILPNGTVDVRYWEVTNNPVRGADGQVSHLFQTSRDVTGTVRARLDTAMVAQELNHRTKNVLAVVQSVARMSSRGDETKDEFVADFTARLSTMSRAHTRLYDNDFRGIELTELLRDEISCMSQSENYQFSGTEVMVNGRIARDLAMIVHELATNAAKHGCFSKESGHLLLSWDEDIEGRLVLTWKETGVGPVDLEEDAGFGTKLFRMMPQINCNRTGTADGLVATLTCANYAVAND